MLLAFEAASCPVYKSVDPTLPETMVQLKTPIQFPSGNEFVPYQLTKTILGTNNISTFLLVVPTLVRCYKTKTN